MEHNLSLISMSIIWIRKTMIYITSYCVATSGVSNNVRNLVWSVDDKMNPILRSSEHSKSPKIESKNECKT